jgi:hypothetical protein
MYLSFEKFLRGLYPQTPIEYMGKEWSGGERREEFRGEERGGSRGKGTGEEGWRASWMLAPKNGS